MKCYICRIHPGHIDQIARLPGKKKIRRVRVCSSCFESMKLNREAIDIKAK